MTKQIHDLSNVDFNPRLKFDNLSGRRLVTSEAVSDLLQLEVCRGECARTKDNCVPGRPDSYPGGTGGQVEQDQVVEAPSRKDLIKLRAEVNATAAGIHIFHRRTTSGDIKASTISMEIPVPKFQFDNWFGSGHVISEVILSLLRCFPAATRANIPFNDTFEAVSDPPINAPGRLGGRGPSPARGPGG